MIRKFFLHVSRKEQERRFRERLENPEKNWKFSSDRFEGAGTVAEVPERLRGHDSLDRDAGGALVRRACRSQVVHPRRRRGGDR